MADLKSYNRIGAIEAQAMERVLKSLLNSGEPAHAIARVIERGTSPDATVFERYASALLKRTGGQHLFVSRNPESLRIVQPENGRLAQLVSTKSIPAHQEATLLGVECAINRLVCIGDAISDGRCEGEPEETAPRRSISILGGGYLASEKGWRSARIILPNPAQTGGITQRYYNEVDWRSTDCVASNARAVFQHCLRPNAYRTTLGIGVPAKSDWDVRTRLAQLLRALELPHRYSFRFDHDVASKTVAVAFTCPPLGFLPSTPTSGSTGAAPMRRSAYQCYLLRLASLFGAACFGSGRAIERAYVTGYDASWKTPLVSAQFERDGFVRSVLAHVDADDFSNPVLRFDSQAVADMICAPHLDWLGRDSEKDDVGESDVEFTVPEGALRLDRVSPELDTRPLSEDAQKLFHCARICDVDTSHYLGGHADAVDLARNDSEESPLASILRLESLVEELEESTAAPPDDAQARPLFAPDPLSRLAIGLLDDELSVADQAQAFLWNSHDAYPKDEPSVAAQAQAFLREASENPPFDNAPPHYYRVPNALYHAHFGLSCLYQEMRDFSTAELHANRCIALAPTTAGAYYRKADVLAEKRWCAQAANVLITGLRTSSVSSDSAFLYFHLGMLLWNLEEKSKAACVHAYNVSLSGEYAEKSKKVIKALRERGEALDTAHASPFTASHLLLKMGIPVAPVSLRSEVARATIALANSGSPDAAAPYARQLERQCGNDEVIAAACRSIQFGLQMK